jgi:trigger factor
MQITEKEHKGLSYSFAVTVPAADIEKEVEAELNRIGGKVKVSGFRPGKVPMNILKQKYGKDVMGDVLQTSINNATRKLVEDKKLRPALQPDVKITSFEEGKDLSFDVELEVFPEVPALDFDKITVDELTVDVPETEVQTSLERLAKSRTHPHTKEGKAEKGDVVKIDFVGKRDGVAFPGGTGNGFQLELGSGQFIPGFEEQLIGSAAGDKVDVKVTFPKEYHSKDLAGAEATFDVTVHEVAYLHTPEIDEKLATNLGFETLDKLKDAVKEQLGAEFTRAGRNKAKKQLFDLLDEKLKFEIPQNMLKLERESILKQVEEAKKAGDPELKDKSEDEIKKEYEKIAERRVKLGILLSEIGRTNNLQVTREELSAAVMNQARNYPGQEDKVFEFYRKNPAQLDDLRGPILEEKAVDFLLGKVKRNKVATTIEALMGEDEAEAEAKPAKKKAAKK